MGPSPLGRAGPGGSTGGEVLVEFPQFRFVGMSVGVSITPGGLEHHLKTRISLTPPPPVKALVTRTSPNACGPPVQRPVVKSHFLSPCMNQNPTFALPLSEFRRSRKK